MKTRQKQTSARAAPGGHWHYLRLIIIALLALWFTFAFLASHSQSMKLLEPATASLPLASATNPEVGHGGSLSPSAPTPESGNAPEATSSFPGLSFPSLPSIDPAQFLWDGIIGVLDRFWKAAIEFIQRNIIDVASAYGFLYITPAALSYRNPLVHAGIGWSLTALDGLVALLLIMAGYQMLLHRYLELEERGVMAAVLRVAAAAVISHLGFLFLLPQLIELCNLISMSFLTAMMKAAGGDLSLPLGAINWATQPLAWGIFILIHFLVTLLFLFVQIVRLAVLDVCILDRKSTV